MKCSTSLPPIATQLRLTFQNYNFLFPGKELLTTWCKRWTKLLIVRLSLSLGYPFLRKESITSVSWNLPNHSFFWSTPLSKRSINNTLFDSLLPELIILFPSVLLQNLSFSITSMFFTLNGLEQQHLTSSKAGEKIAFNYSIFNHIHGFTFVPRLPFTVPILLTHFLRHNLSYTKF